MAKQPKKPAEVKSKGESRSYFTVRKRTMRLYELVEIAIDADGKATETILKADLPVIILGLLVRSLRNQGFAP